MNATRYELEAHLVAICCSQAPEGRNLWTLSLLVNELKNRKLYQFEKRMQHIG